MRNSQNEVQSSSCTRDELLAVAANSINHGFGADISRWGSTGIEYRMYRSFTFPDYWYDVLRAQPSPDDPNLLECFLWSAHGASEQMRDFAMLVALTQPAFGHYMVSSAPVGSPRPIAAYETPTWTLLARLRSLIVQYGMGYG